MCFCDGEYFVINNKTTGSVHCVNGDDDVYKFFEGFCSIYSLFQYMTKREQIRWKDNYYTLAINSHPECEQLKRTIAKCGDLKDPSVWGKCPEKYRHMLPKERQ